MDLEFAGEILCERGWLGLQAGKVQITILLSGNSGLYQLGGDKCHQSQLFLTG